MTEELWDLAIVGAGPAGSTCACSALANNQNIRVALIDRENFPRDKSCGDAIRNDAASLLKQLGLESTFEGRPRINSIRPSVSAKFQYLTKLLEFDRHTYFVIERNIFDNDLHEAAIARGAQAFVGHSMTHAVFDDSENLWNIATKNKAGSETTIRAKVLVGADGAGSRVRRAVGLKKNSDRNSLLGIRAYAKAKGFDRTALRVDFPDLLIPGYGWVFPLQNEKINIGLCLDVRDYRRFHSTLEEHLNSYVSYLTAQGLQVHDLEDCKSSPLPLALADLPLVPCKQVALIGDAASMIDPLSGEGIHFGVWAGYTLGHAVSRGLNEQNIQVNLEKFAAKFTDKFGTELQDSEEFRIMLRFQRMFHSDSFVSQG